MNDEAIARRLAADYESQGMDPSLAFAQTDDEFLTDFGGPEAFR